MSLSSDKIILISAKQRGGKDTACDILLNFLPNFKRVGFADHLKDEYCSLFNIDRNQIDTLKNSDPKVRHGLIVNAEVRKLDKPDYFAEKAFQLNSGSLIVPDWRFLVESQYADNEDNRQVIKIRIEATREVRLARAIAAGGTLSNETHYGETQLDSYPNFDFVVENNTIMQDLIDRLEPIANYIKNQ